MSNENRSLDKTVAWCVGCLLIAILAVIGTMFASSYHEREIGRDAIKSGYCQVQNPPGQLGYHWEKCQ